MTEKDTERQTKQTEIDKEADRYREADVKVTDKETNRETDIYRQIADKVRERETDRQAERHTGDFFVIIMKGNCTSPCRLGKFL